MRLAGLAGVLGSAGCLDLLSNGEGDDHGTPASFSIRDLNPEETIIEAGDVFSIRATISNEGTEVGTETIELRLDDEPIASENLTLDGGAEATFTFEEVSSEGLDAGEYTIGIYGYSDQVTGSIQLVIPEIAITFDPYAGIHWESVETYKTELHAHLRNAYAEVVDLIDLYRGNREDVMFQTLAEGDEYDMPAVSYGTGPPCPYWPWDDLSQHDCWSLDYDPEEEGIVGFPVVEIDDVWHTNVLFNYGMPNHVNDDHPDYADWEEAVEVIIDDTAHTVVDGTEETPLIMPAHPARYYDEPHEDGIAAYRETFESYSLADGLVGIEGLTKAWDPWRSHQGEANAERWDDVILAGLLSDLDGREGPCLMFGTDDPNTHEIGHDIDRRWTDVLLEPADWNPSDQDASRRVVYEAMKAGNFFASQRVPWDHGDEDPPMVPTVRRVDVDVLEETITVEADGGTVYWINAHETPAGDEETYRETALRSGSTFNYGEHGEIVDGSHVIPHVLSLDGTVETLLQPFTFEKSDG